tara:strand:- start:4083 stop:4409 length:327 start_codon:yes stop_codon:yes gene_type:complete
MNPDAIITLRNLLVGDRFLGTSGQVFLCTYKTANALGFEGKHHKGLEVSLDYSGDLKVTLLERTEPIKLRGFKKKPVPEPLLGVFIPPSFHKDWDTMTIDNLLEQIGA